MFANDFDEDEANEKVDNGCEAVHWHPVPQHAFEDFIFNVLYLHRDYVLREEEIVFVSIGHDARVFRMGYEFREHRENFLLLYYTFLVVVLRESMVLIAVLQEVNVFKVWDGERAYVDDCIIEYATLERLLERYAVQ